MDGAPQQVRAEALGAGIPPDAWGRVEVGAGSKGPRVYDWACGRLPYEAEAGWAQWLLVRRAADDPGELASYRVYAPADTPLAAMARVAGARWVIEECIERATGEVGLDHYEVRRWDGWYRHVTLCLLAHAPLEVARAAANASEAKRGRRTTWSR